MKKSLVALAVLAASGASFAQVSITGTVAMGYRVSGGVGATAASTGADASGLGTDTTVLNFAAKEDLGGGKAIEAKFGLDGVTRGGVGAGDASLAVSGGFGKISLATGRGSDYLSGGVSGVGGVGFDDKVFSRLDASDSIGYTSPSMGGFTLGLSHAEAATSRAAELTTPIGLGVGATGIPVANTYQRSSGVTGSYAAGPLAVTLNYTMYDQQGVGGTAAAVGDSNNSKSRVSIAGAYDFGMAKLGAGFRSTQFTLGTRNDSFLAVGVPLGALTLGADWGSRTQADRVTATDNGTRTGTGVKADYALSKRTSVIASYARWDAVVGAAGASTETNLLLSHSF